MEPTPPVQHSSGLAVHAHRSYITPRISMEKYIPHGLCMLSLWWEPGVAALEGSDEVSAMPRNTKPHGQSPSKPQDKAISVFKCLSDFSLNYITDFHIIKIRKKTPYIFTERMHLNSCSAYIFRNQTDYLSLNLDRNFITVWTQSPFQGLTKKSAEWLNKQPVELSAFSSHRTEQNSVHHRIIILKGSF